MQILKAKKKWLILAIFLAVGLIFTGTSLAKSLAFSPQEQAMPELTKWKVVWYSLTGDMEWGGKVGEEIWSATTFDIDWSYANVYKGYRDYIGFQATTKIFCPFDGLVWFQIGSDDYSWLFVDGKLVLELGHGAFDTTQKDIFLPKGEHSLKLFFMEKRGKAHVKFKCSKHVIVSKADLQIEELKQRVEELEKKFEAWKESVSQGDVNLDGIVDVYDLVKVGKNFGKKLEATIIISDVNYDAPGDDNENLNGKWVEIKNYGYKEANLKGYVLKDEAGHEFIFPEVILSPGSRLKVFSGSGKNTSSKLYWGSSRVIWNNEGDTAYLYNARKKLVDKYEW